MSVTPPSQQVYERDGDAIYAQSFAMIRSETDLSGCEPSLEPVVVRMIHACGQVDLVGDVAASPGFADIAKKALIDGAPILCDSHMVASGITRTRLPANNEVVCTLRDSATRELAKELGTTISAAAVELWREKLAGSVVAVGNAPTALFHLLDLIAAGGPRPAAIVGIPVGFVGAVESKEALSVHSAGIPWLVVRGRRGGSAITAAAINALASGAENYV